MRIMLSPEEYAKSLPRKHSGVVVLFFNDKDELLVVKPNYKDGWILVGGSIDDNESPLSSAIRETKEEIGLEISDLHFVSVHYISAVGPFSDSYQFVFNGGKLSNEQIGSIKLQKEELDEYAFVSVEKAKTMLTPRMNARIKISLDVMKNSGCGYAESVKL